MSIMLNPLAQNKSALVGPHDPQVDVEGLRKSNIKTKDGFQGTR